MSRQLGDDDDGRLAPRVIGEVSAVLNRALASDPAIGETLSRARRLLLEGTADDDSATLYRRAVDQAADLIGRTEAGVLLGPGERVALCLRITAAEPTFDEDGTPRPVMIDAIRVRAVPGVQDRPLWLLASESDVDAMRAYLEPGQVWVRADIVSVRQWPRIRALAADQAQRVLGRVRPPGRQRGSVNPARAALVEQVRAHPEMTDDAVHDQGVASGVWDSAAYDRKVIASRIRRIRADAERIKA